MKASEARLLGILKQAQQFVIPIYQRTYSWTDKQCQQLWDDILRAGDDDSVSVHFVGSVVYIAQSLSQVTNQSPLLVIDGQQRLTTVSLLLAALANAIGDGEPLDGFSATKIRHYYLTNPLEGGERFFKLALSQTDNDTLHAIVRGGEEPNEPSIRISENYELFSELIGGQRDLARVCRGLSKLMVVDVALTRGEDNPQLIFESMNSTGKELSQADLIRNFILMGLEPELQTRLYQELWRPMEQGFGQEAYGEQFDDFMRHYLTLRTGNIPRTDEVYEAFKEFARPTAGASGGIEALLRDLRVLARHYCAMALGREADPDIAAAFQDLRELRVDVAYPFLLEAYDDYSRKLLSKEDLLSIVRLVESYVFRRTICSIPANSLNKTFATFGRALKKDHYLESIKAHFLSLPSYRRFPDDEEFQRELRSRDLYHTRVKSYWLRRLENDGRKEPASVGEYTVEHIMPQNPDLSPAWRVSLGEQWRAIQERWLHTLGNLTLTAYNSEYSDRPFVEKRDHVKGFKSSPLRLNEGLGALADWNEEAIRQRAARLALRAVEVWRAPSLPPDVLITYRPATGGGGTYSLEDHRFIGEGTALRPLFEAFRREVLALDPCVTEDIRKLYVAFKAETNFVDVVPQSTRLRLTLNMKFHELDDPRGLAEDVTDRGRWGNGDIQVALEELNELPYVMGLVRQALERQMGGGGA